MKLTPSLTLGVVYSVPQHSPLDAWSCTVTGSANGRATGGKLPYVDSSSQVDHVLAFAGAIKGAPRKLSEEVDEVVYR